MGTKMIKKILCAIFIALVISHDGNIYSMAKEPDDMAAPQTDEQYDTPPLSDAGIAMTKEDLNIVFALDHSGSMDKQDGDKMIPQILQIFVDTMYSENIRIGYIAYNDSVIGQKEPVSVNNENERIALKQVMDGSDYKGETDIGLGLREAYGLLDGCSGSKMIVLISDGETDLAYSNTGRTEEDSRRDAEETIQLCKSEGTPIITIAFGGEYAGEESLLEDMSDQTGGQCYRVETAEDLIDVIFDLFHADFSYSVRKVSTSTYDAGKQTIRSGMEGVYYDELAVLLCSDQEITDALIIDDGKKIVPQILGDYAVAALMNSGRDFSIEFQTGQGQKMSVLLIGKRSITPTVRFDGNIYKNQETVFNVQFTDRDGKPLEDAGLYERFQWQAGFVSRTTAVEIPAEIRTVPGGLTGRITFAESGSYDLFLTTGQNAENRYVASKVEVLNTLPNSKKGDMVKLLTLSGEQTLNLSDYFEDADGDKLSFEIMGTPQGVADVTMEGDLVRIRPQKRGTGNIVLLVSDGEGELIGQIPVQVRSWVEAYSIVPIILLCILLFILIKVYLRKRKTVVTPEVHAEKNKCYFTGKLNAYFTLLPNDMDEIPPLTFVLHHIREGRIVIGDMFKNYPEVSTFLELDHMLLYPAESRKVIFYHNSRASVMIDNSIVCRKMKYVIAYGSIIYITSQDGSYELELHYISTV